MPSHTISEESPPDFAAAVEACGVLGRPDWLLWPEFALNRLYHARVDFDVTPRLESLTEFATAHNVALVVGCNRRESEGESSREYNSVILIDPCQEKIGWYDKMALIPWNEFAPWIAWPGMMVVEGGFEHGREATVHDLWAPSKEKPYRVAATVCYDTCFAWVHRRFFHGTGNVDAFLTCSSELLDDQERGSRQILALGKLRAVECRRAIVRNVFHGFSAIIDGNGVVRFQALDVNSPVLAGCIPIDRRWSLYRQFGDWLPILVLALWLLCQAPRR